MLYQIDVLKSMKTTVIRTLREVKRLSLTVALISEIMKV